MDFEIQPATEGGRAYVALCEEHAADFATRADEHDREATFPFENLAALRESKVLSAALPEEFGGLGLDSTRDLVAGLNRLARGDGSTAIAANMHIATPWYVTRLWRDAQARSDAEVDAQTAGILHALSATIVCVSSTEPGTTFRAPLTEATRADGGWKLNGRKIFGTLSPVADLIIVPCRFATDDGGWGGSYAFVPRDMPGLTINDDWDALGMRASGSNSLTFTDCFVPTELFNPQLEPWGQWSIGLLLIQISSNLALTSAMVGIAEAARATVVDMLKTRRKAPSNTLLSERSGIQHQMGELEIDLATARAMVDRSATNSDAYILTHNVSDMDLTDAHELMRDFQCTKWVANRKAIDVVDRALTLSGGTGYFNSSPLSRYYRDVRAGPFMQAYSPNEAREYIGRNALGLPPDNDL
jgi:alkylation response protein AidB-like acyl-CoA dehydrogenase